MSNAPLSDRLATASEDTLREMIREAEVHLASQQTVALAADQRAITLTGFLSAAAVVLIGSAASYALGSSKNVALAVICIMVAAALLASVFLAVRAAQPSGFDFAGSSPEDWVADVEASRPLTAALAEQCANYAGSIADNHERMKRNGRLLMLSINVAFAAIAVGGVAFVLTLAFS